MTYDNLWLMLIGWFLWCYCVVKGIRLWTIQPPLPDLREVAPDLWPELRRVQA